ncbi:MAG: hypothetical protein D3908_01970 [Candidatus Electrothrix sp. AUS4]|nr:hypothetical protein [Candidatus Electrothrix sp. AUS4]
MFKYFLEEFDIRSDLKRRSKLFVSLFKNKDTNSALLWGAGISILFFSLPNIIGGYAFLVFPAVLSLYLLVAYQLLLSFVSFKLTAFNVQMQFKDSSSGWLSKHILQYVSPFIGNQESVLLDSCIKDSIKSIWSWISEKIATTFEKIRSGGKLRKIIRIYKKIGFRRRKNGLFQKILRGISRSYSYFWQLVIEFVVLCIPSDRDRKGFTNIYLNILFVLYYTTLLKILNKASSLFVNFIINLPSLSISFLCGIPRFLCELLCDLLLKTAINALLKIIFIVIGVPVLLIVSFIESAGSVLAFLCFIVRLPYVVLQIIKQIIFFLRGLTLDRVKHWFLAVSLLLISIVFSLLSFRLEFSAAISEQLILSISELSAILAICAFVMISSTVATRKAYLGSFVVLFILTVMHGAYFVLVGSMLFLYFRAAYKGDFKKTFYLFFYLSFLYLIQKIGFSDAYSDVFKNGGVILLLVTDYEGDVEYPSFLFLALHGSYQELERILKKRVGLYDEHAETTVDSVNFARMTRPEYS